MTLPRRYVGIMGTILAGATLGGIAVTPVAAADPGFTTAENQFLSHLYAPGPVAHPPVNSQGLVSMGWQACTDISNGMSPDDAKYKLQGDLRNEGILDSEADVGTLVHFALRDLCPNVPNSTGI